MTTDTSGLPAIGSTVSHYRILGGQDAASAEILDSRQVSGRGEESLFAPVDDMRFHLTLAKEATKRV